MLDGWFGLWVVILTHHTGRKPRRIHGDWIAADCQHVKMRMIIEISRHVFFRNRFCAWQGLKCFSLKMITIFCTLIFCLIWNFIGWSKILHGKNCLIIVLFWYVAFFQIGILNGFLKVVAKRTHIRAAFLVYNYPCWCTLSTSGDRNSLNILQAAWLHLTHEVALLCREHISPIVRDLVDVILPVLMHFLLREKNVLFLLNRDVIEEMQ